MKRKQSMIKMTENMRRAKERKSRNRVERKLTDEREAARLHITVSELKTKRFREEVSEPLAAAAERERKEALERASSGSSRRRGYGGYGY